MYCWYPPLLGGCIPPFTYDMIMVHLIQLEDELLAGHA